MLKQWISDNSGLLLFIALAIVSAVYVGKLLLQESFADHRAVMKSSSRPNTRTGQEVVVRRGEAAWYVYVGSHVTFVCAYLWLFIAGVRDKFAGYHIAILIATFMLQVGAIVFLPDLALMLE